MTADDLTDEERAMLTASPEQLAEVRRVRGWVVDRDGNPWRGDLSWW